MRLLAYAYVVATGPSTRFSIISKSLAFETQIDTLIGATDLIAIVRLLLLFLQKPCSIFDITSS